MSRDHILPIGLMEKQTRRKLTNQQAAETYKKDLKKVELELRTRSSWTVLYSSCNLVCNCNRFLLKCNTCDKFIVRRQFPHFPANQSPAQHSPESKRSKNSNMSSMVKFSKHNHLHGHILLLPFLLSLIM